MEEEGGAQYLILNPYLSLEESFTRVGIDTYEECVFEGIYMFYFF